MNPISNTTDGILVRHEGNKPRERSACGWRDRPIGREDARLSPAAWAHAFEVVLPLRRSLRRRCVFAFFAAIEDTA